MTERAGVGGDQPTESHEFEGNLWPWEKHKMSDQIRELAAKMAARLHDKVWRANIPFKTTGPGIFLSSNKFDRNKLSPRSINGGESLLLNGFKLNEDGMVTAIFIPTLGGSAALLKSVGTIQIPVDPRFKGDRRNAEQIVTYMPETTEKVSDGRTHQPGIRVVNIIDWTEEALSAMDDLDGTTLANMQQKADEAAAKARMEALQADERFGSW